ncbi:hypothetical protein [Variovorax saccharolyticus]|uniref:hypothetical protein n=1 Tax=Variovorax saccharolyticus TaxID=3053516 RepID=UPI002578CE2C|nr:hypothetical protein [Variovorax sp. J31P216]MDM0026186.1 hypothetical protein [Variovorax sp. J31P216]
MRKIIPLLGATLIQMVAGAALAQSSGEVDPAQGKAPPTARTTPAERSDARTERRATGREAARGPQMGEAQANPVTAPSKPRADRKAAASKRRAANATANKQGQFSRGGNTDAPERQTKP